MSHTTKLEKGWIVIHDGDLRNSSDIILIKDSTEYIIPFSIMEELVAKSILDDAIRKLDNISTSDILYSLLNMEKYNAKI